MNDRIKAKIEQVSKSLTEEGLIKSDVQEGSDSGPGDYPSYFEFMIDQKLDGKSALNSQEMWEAMKKQINYLSRELRNAADEYKKMENRCRTLTNDLSEIIKEK